MLELTGGAGNWELDLRPMAQPVQLRIIYIMLNYVNAGQAIKPGPLDDLTKC